VVSKWIKGPARKPLLWMIERSVREVSRGGWTSGLECDLSRHLAGHSAECMWHSDRTLSHLRTVADNLRNSRPVLCREFRQCEAKRLQQFLERNGDAAFNHPILHAIRDATQAVVLLLTDRPAESLAISPGSPR